MPVVPHLQNTGSTDCSPTPTPITSTPIPPPSYPDILGFTLPPTNHVRETPPRHYRYPIGMPNVGCPAEYTPQASLPAVPVSYTTMDPRVHPIHDYPTRASYTLSMEPQEAFLEGYPNRTGQPSFCGCQYHQ
ncbi:hypothetical protein Moror_11014 [Moniliophthora roreri MCA 2997]|uniref:Uncharacterized protein n=1 Tax=Moniliophthora roreri (strain MCA 2997) TaxID=1381753 RepID=V2Y0Z6_MONRO|nr:hypothetical protein Moror_11014 [Moniliophthora roreri MCA 2997]